RVARGESGPIETAQRWAADEDAALRLYHAADLALAEASGLTDPARIRKLAQWFDAANRTRDLLRTTVRADLAIAELLVAWRAVPARRAPGQERGGTRRAAPRAAHARASCRWPSRTRRRCTARTCRTSSMAAFSCRPRAATSSATRCSCC